MFEYTQTRINKYVGTRPHTLKGKTLGEMQLLIYYDCQKNKLIKRYQFIVHTFWHGV